MKLTSPALGSTRFAGYLTGFSASNRAFIAPNNVDGFSATIEPKSPGLALVSGALTGDVLPMGSPLSGNGVLRIHDPHRTSLVAGPSALRATAGSNRPALPTRIARWAMWKRLSHVRK
jgi:hypothetical protein